MKIPRAVLLPAAMLAAAALLPAYERMQFNGIPLTRPATVPFQAGSNVAAGLKNADGHAVLTPESEPVAALRAATETWNSVPASVARFVFTVSATPLTAQRNDGVNVFSFADDAETRSTLEGAIAITTVMYSGDGVIHDSDILFSPTDCFATTPTLGCYDLQSIATHELGHALGAGHSFLTTAVMYAYSNVEQTWKRSLASDDIAFVSATYPRDFHQNGSVYGKVAYASGKVTAAALVLVFRASGDFITAVTTNSAGAYSVSGLPPGDYLAIAQPVAPYLGGNGSSAADMDVPDWQATPYGGGDAPQTIPVASGTSAPADITVPDGIARLRIDYVAVGGRSDFSDTYKFASGTPAKVYIYARGIPKEVLPEDILIYGSGLSVRPGSIVAAPAADPKNPDSYGSLSFTLDVAPRASWNRAVVALKSGGFLASEGNFLIQPGGPQFPPSGVTSGASFRSGAAAPGEIVSLFGSGLGPEKPATGSLDATRKLQTSLGGVSVEFDGRAAPLFYVSSTQINAQVPFETAGRASTRVKVLYDGGAREAILPVAAARPEIFGTWDQVCVYDDQGRANSEAHPAMRDSVIVAWGTGQGLVTPALATGAPGSADPSNLNRATVTAKIGGVDAKVEFAGAAPGFVGLLQVNIKVPKNAPTGYQELKLTANGISNVMPAHITVQ
ncbi:MAG TPA: matrixin family metalloprotease [Bryobacteraceae bacterium]